MGVQKTRFSAIAHAKINLNLHVIGMRKDGFHDLQSLVVFAGMGDVITLEFGTGNDQDTLELSGAFSHKLADDNENLVLKAVRKFRQSWPEAFDGAVSISLEKNLPVAAGIGGGSADAAAVLNLLAKGTGKSISRDDLVEIGLSLGADIPVCLQTNPAIMQGKGERVAPVLKLPKMFALLVNPGVHVSTVGIFEKLENKTNPAMPELPESFSSLEQFVEWLHQTRNDLYFPARIASPQISEIIDALSSDKNCLIARMSGSGATVFGLFSSMGQAQNSAEIFRDRWPDYWVAPTQILGSQS